MKLNKLKEIAAVILKIGKSRLVIDEKLYSENKELVTKAITKNDVREIIKKQIIKKRKDQGHSRGAARILLAQKKLKRKRGFGRRKGSPKARAKTNEYNLKVRGLRKKLKELRTKDSLNGKRYSDIYMKIKGNYFRGKKHIDEFVNMKD
ncbi:MAG: 50S ribosomal protein L19e [archaeon]